MQPEDLVVRAEGKKCWYVACGGAAVPSFSLSLGEKLRREKPLRNRSHTEEFRHFQGEFQLIVWCTWRLQTKDRVLASSDQGKPAIAELEALAGCTVRSCRTSHPAWDLDVLFDSGTRLLVFCDHLEPDPSYSINWELWQPTVAIFAGPGEVIEIENR